MSKISRRSAFKIAGGALATASLPGFPSCVQGKDKITTSGIGLSCSDPAFEQIVVSLIDAPKDRVVAVVADQLKQGRTLDEMYSAVFHAAVRAEKRFGLGGGFPHTMLVVHSARQTTKALSEPMQLFPLFCSLDPLKKEQSFASPRSSMRPLLESAVPDSAEDSKKQFEDAMLSCEPERADPAIIGLFRTGQRNAVLEPLYRWATRKNTGIGHFPILVSQATQSLSAFGWDCAEPVLRQIGQALALSPRENDIEIFEANERLIAEEKLILREGQIDNKATIELLAMARQAEPDRIAGEVVKMLKAGVSPRSCWDAVVLAGAEIVLRDAAGEKHNSPRGRPSGIGIHQVDAANALRFIADQTNDQVTKALCLLQAAAWMPYFTRSAKFASSTPKVQIDQLEPSTKTPATLDDVFVATKTDKLEAGRRALAWIKSGKSIDDLKKRALELAIRKFDDPHQFKFPVALFQESNLTNHRWMPAMLATQAMYGKLNADPDWKMLEEAEAAIATIPS